MSYKDRWGQYYKGAGDTFPQGIGSIGGYLEANGHACDIIEPDVAGQDLAVFREMVGLGEHTLYGISCFTTNMAYAFETARIIRQEKPQAKIVVGGAHPTLFPRRTLEECPEIDFVITHEGEKPMLALLDALERGTPLEQVPNLHFRCGDEIVSNEQRCAWLDLNELPLFPYHKFDMNLYTPAPSLRRVLPTFNYMAQRGCPYNCSFCDTRTHGRKVRYRRVELVLDDLASLKQRFGINGLIFEGSNFTADAAWVRDLCAGMKERGLKLAWYGMGRVDMEPDLLPLMRRAGCWCLSFGIESANAATLKRMHKGITPKRTQETIAQARRLGIRTIGSFILGYPGENKQDLLNTVEFACALELDVAVFFIPVPFPGTQLYEDAQRLGGLKPDITWSDYLAWLDHNRPIYVNPLIGPEHVDLYNYAFRRFYARPRYLLRQFTSIRSASDLARMLKGFQSVGGLIQKGLRRLGRD